jgi:hypothetical protein
LTFDSRAVRGERLDDRLVLPMAGNQPACSIFRATSIRHRSRSYR